MAVATAATAAALALTMPALHAAPGDQPVKPLPPSALSGKSAIEPRTTSLPARGLFDGDHLTDSARQQLTELILNSLGMRVEVALIVPTGPWKIDDNGTHERDLTPARLQAVKRFLTERGVDPKQIFVESRVDQKLKEPRLDVQIMGRPAID
jgi:OOP family OmpA-OmpF porin